MWRKVLSWVALLLNGAALVLLLLAVLGFVLTEADGEGTGPFLARYQNLAVFVGLLVYVGVNIAAIVFRRHPESGAKAVQPSIVGEFD